MSVLEYVSTGPERKRAEVDGVQRAGRSPRRPTARAGGRGSAEGAVKPKPKIAGRPYAGGLGAGVGAGGGAGLLVPPFSSFSPPHWGVASSEAAKAGATDASVREATTLATSVLLGRSFMRANLTPRTCHVKPAADSAMMSPGRRPAAQGWLISMKLMRVAFSTAEPWLTVRRPSETVTALVLERNWLADSARAFQ
jgi:hypothetical protein